MCLYLLLCSVHPFPYQFNSIKMPLFVIQFLECCHTTRASRGKWRQQKNRLRNANTQDIVYKIYDNGIAAILLVLLANIMKLIAGEPMWQKNGFATNADTHTEWNCVDVPYPILCQNKDLFGCCLVYSSSRFFWRFAPLPLSLPLSLVRSFIFHYLCTTNVTKRNQKSFFWYCWQFFLIHSFLPMWFFTIKHLNFMTLWVD